MNFSCSSERCDYLLFPLVAVAGRRARSGLSEVIIYRLTDTDDCLQTTGPPAIHRHIDPCNIACCRGGKEGHGVRNF